MKFWDIKRKAYRSFNNQEFFVAAIIDIRGAFDSINRNNNYIGKTEYCRQIKSFKISELRGKTCSRHRVGTIILILRIVYTQGRFPVRFGERTDHVQISRS